MSRRARSRRGTRKGRWGSPSRGGRWAALIVLTLLVGLVGAGGVWSWSHLEGSPGEPMSFEVNASAPVEELCAQLEKAGLIDDARLFRWYLVLTRRAPKVRAGAHLLRRGLSPAALVARLSRSGARPVVKFTIVEGHHRFMIAERLQTLEITHRDAFLAASVNPEKLAPLGITAPSAEGYLFPATYDLYVDSDETLVLRTFARETARRYELIAQRYPRELAALRSESGWGMHELLTLASIVEKEAADGEEHGRIASVFYNRLKDPGFLPRQMLQSDPTAGYGCLLAGEELQSCKGYTGRVTPAMLRDPSNTYNTYKHPGLPPGPIGNPSHSAIEAVINPPHTPYFFFVAGHSKRHVFSRTLSEHERAIATGADPEEGEGATDDAPRERGSNMSQRPR